jgi:hypothetical protein
MMRAPWTVAYRVVTPDILSKQNTLEESLRGVAIWTVDLIVDRGGFERDQARSDRAC